jgi:transposase
MLWELSVTEQRYRAVLEVRAGVPVTEVAERYGVSRQSVHAWLRHYRKIVNVTASDRTFQVSLDGEIISVVPRTTTREVHRDKAYATRTSV